MREPVTKRRPMVDMEEFERRLRQSFGSEADDDLFAELAHLICGQKGSVQSAGPQGQSSTEARRAPRPSSKLQEPEAKDPEPLQC
jgi:hypothetical protein